MGVDVDSSKYIYIRLALGNESCDLDSFASSLVASYLFYLRGVGSVINRLERRNASSDEDRDTSRHAFWKTRKIHHTLRCKSEWIVLPIIFTTRPLFMLRGDCVKACELFGLNVNDFIFIDEWMDFLKRFTDKYSEAPTNIAEQLYRRSSSAVASLKPKIASPAPSPSLESSDAGGAETTSVSSRVITRMKVMVLDMVLVDQPNIPLYLKQFLLKNNSFIRFKISCIYDHHAEDASVKPFLERRSRLIKTIEAVSSNMTILAHEFQRLLSGAEDPYMGSKLSPFFSQEEAFCRKFVINLFGLMLATILVDSNNLDLNNSGRVTKKDIDIVAWLSTKLEVLDLFNVLSPFLANVQGARFPANSTSLLFEVINNAKMASNRAIDLTSDLALEKDLKLYELVTPGSTYIYGISSIGTSLQDWMQKATIGGYKQVLQNPDALTTDEADRNIASVLISHLEKYSLDFFLIISAFQPQQSDESAAPPKLERQLCLFAPLKSDLLRKLQHSNSYSTFESELAQSNSSLLRDEFIMKPISSVTTTEEGSLDLTPSMIFYGLFGQDLIDVLKLVNNEHDMPNYLFSWDPSTVPDPIRPAAVKGPVKATKHYHVLSSFSQLDTTYSRKKVQPLLHKRLLALLQ